MLFNRNYDFQAGDTIVADQIDQEFNTLRTILNGNISGENIADASIDLTKLSADINPVIRTAELDGNAIVSGIGLTGFSGSHTSGWSNRNDVIKAGIAYVRGERVVTQDYPVTFQASATSWVDLDTDGVFHITVNSTEPAVYQNSMRVMKVVCDGTKITEYQPLGFGDVGTVIPFAGKYAPKGYELCHGQEITRSTYDKLWQVIGSIHGAPSDGTKIKLPDCRTRAVHGHGDPTYYLNLGEKGGAVDKNHSHGVGTNAAGDHSHGTGAGYYDGGVSSNLATYTSSWAPPGHRHDTYSGGSHSHSAWSNNASVAVDPYIVLNYIIKVA
jgi:microcystin-dependent protein